MSSSNRVVEWVKTALIVVLSTSALLLGWRTGLLNDFLRDIPFFGSVAGFVQEATGTETVSVSAKEAARPLTIVITDADGERFGVRYDTDMRNTIYDRMSVILREALGSISDIEEISEDEWRTALGGAGVYFEYASPVRLSVMDAWLRAGMPDIKEDVSMRRVFVAFSEDRNRIYFSDHDSGLFFGAETASSAGITQTLGAYAPNGARFAFETNPEIASKAPYLLVLFENLHPVISSVAAGRAELLLDMAIDAFGHRGEQNITDYDAAGALVCTGTEFTIRVEQDGTVIYRRTDGLPSVGRGPILNESKMIEQARAVVADTIGTTSGDADVFFESFENDLSNYSVVTFGYYIAGGYVSLPEDGYAARVVFIEGMITEAELNFRSFIITDELVWLLPEIQALAAAGGDFMLCWSDAGPELLQPFWVRV